MGSKGDKSPNGYQGMEKIIIDPSRVRYGLSLEELFGLTKVQSLEDYARLKSILPDLRGQSYFFINVLDGEVRLMITILVAEGDTTTVTYSLDPSTFGITHEELTGSFCDIRMVSGNYPIPSKIEQKLNSALKKQSFEVRTNLEHRVALFSFKGGPLRRRGGCL